MKIRELLNIMEEIENKSIHGISVYSKNQNEITNQTLLNEVEYASALSSSMNLKPYMNTEQGKLVGHMDNTEVYVLNFKDVDIYFLYNDEPLVYAVLNKDTSLDYPGYYVIRQMEKYSTIRGLGTALAHYIINKEKKKLVIPKRDKWTYSGMSWLTHTIISGGRGLKFTDNSGNTPDVKMLWSEWEDNRLNQTPGKTTIFIENKNRHVDSRLFEDNSGGILKPPYAFIKSDFLE